MYIGRFLIVWAVLYLTFFLGSKRKIVQGILFAVAAIASVVGIVVLLDGWSSWGNQTFLPLGLQTWGWIDIAVIPLLFALFKFRKSVIPVIAAICFSIALPWCQRTWTEYYNYGRQSTASTCAHGPNLAAHALVAAFAVFIIWWGVRQPRKALVNLGIVGFAIAVGWFYFSDIFDKLDRSLGLIGLGILFLAGGWALEKTRRKIVGRHGKSGRFRNEFPGGAMKLSKTSIVSARDSVGAGLVHRGQVSLPALDLPAGLDARGGLRSGACRCAAAT